MLDIKSIFGNNLKTLRLSLGLSQEEFAEKAGIDDKMISLLLQLLQKFVMELE